MNEIENQIQMIADLHGSQHQKLKLIEEMGELTEILIKSMLCIGDKKIKCDLISELADVSIMLEQVIYLLKCDKYVQKVRQRKIERLIKRMQDAGIKIKSKDAV